MWCWRKITPAASGRTRANCSAMVHLSELLQPPRSDFFKLFHSLPCRSRGNADQLLLKKSAMRDATPGRRTASSSPFLWRSWHCSGPVWLQSLQLTSNHQNLNALLSYVVPFFTLDFSDGARFIWRLTDSERMHLLDVMSSRLILQGSPSCSTSKQQR